RRWALGGWSSPLREAEAGLLRDVCPRRRRLPSRLKPNRARPAAVSASIVESNKSSPRRLRQGRGLETIASSPASPLCSCLRPIGSSPHHEPHHHEPQRQSRWSRQRSLSNSEARSVGCLAPPLVVPRSPRPPRLASVWPLGLCPERGAPPNSAADLSISPGFSAKEPAGVFSSASAASTTAGRADEAW
ncbi:hypothetical protein THAOC_00676, partial [Thalassiosira oceanica]